MPQEQNSLPQSQKNLIEDNGPSGHLWNSDTRRGDRSGQQSWFLGMLPSEIRLQIYEFAFRGSVIALRGGRKRRYGNDTSSDDPDQLMKSSEGVGDEGQPHLHLRVGGCTGLLRASKRVRAEALPVFYSCAILQVDRHFDWYSQAAECLLAREDGVLQRNVQWLEESFLMVRATNHDIDLSKEARFRWHLFPSLKRYLLEPHLIKSVGYTSEVGPYNEDVTAVREFKDATKEEDQPPGKHGVEGFLRSDYLHQQISKRPLRLSYNYRLLFRLARLQREFRGEGIQGRVVIDIPLYLSGRLWLVWPGITEEDTQDSRKEFLDRGPRIDKRPELQRGPCAYAVSQTCNLRRFTESATGVSH